MLILFLFAISKHRTGFVRQSKTIPRTCQLGWHVLQGGLARQRGKKLGAWSDLFRGGFPLGSPPRRPSVEHVQSLDWSNVLHQSFLFLKIKNFNLSDMMKRFMELDIKKMKLVVTVVILIWKSK